MATVSFQFFTGKSERANQYPSAAPREGGRQHDQPPEVVPEIVKPEIQWPQPPRQPPRAETLIERERLGN